MKLPNTAEKCDHSFGVPFKDIAFAVAVAVLAMGAIALLIPPISYYFEMWSRYWVPR